MVPKARPQRRWLAFNSSGKAVVADALPRSDS